MPFSDFFHPDCDPVEPSDAPHHVVFSCLQWKTPSLEVMPRAAKQCFAVMYGDPLNPHTSAAMERAYILGAMSPVKLIAAHEETLYLFLDNEVSSNTFLEVEALWTKVIGMSRILLSVHFASVSEVYSGRSDYIFWHDAKEILESYDLGIEPYDLKDLDDFSNEALTDEQLWAYLSQVVSSQPGVIQVCPVEVGHIAKMTGHSKCFMSPYYIHPPISRKPDA
jgi:hypothetical protein